MLFRFRFQADDSRERRAFIDGLSLDWESVSDEERREVAEHLVAATPGLRRSDEETWYKVDWEKVPELIERRTVFLSRGKAYVPEREQLSMIIAEFTTRLERALEVRGSPQFSIELATSKIDSRISSRVGHCPGLMKMSDSPRSSITCQKILGAPSPSTPKVKGSWMELQSPPAASILSLNISRFACAAYT
jgi:hypothetical protein